MERTIPEEFIEYAKEQKRISEYFKAMRRRRKAERRRQKQIDEKQTELMVKKDG